MPNNDFELTIYGGEISSLLNLIVLISSIKLIRALSSKAKSFFITTNLLPEIYAPNSKFNL